MVIETWERPKDPDEVIEYFILWARPLRTATILTSEWTVLQGSVTVAQSGIDKSRTWALLSGGADGTYCVLHNQIVTSQIFASQNQVLEKSVRLKIKSI
jgi:hypothetical protein